MVGIAVVGIAVVGIAGGVPALLRPPYECNPKLRQAILTALYRDATLLRPPYECNPKVAPSDFDRRVQGYRLTLTAL